MINAFFIGRLGKDAEEATSGQKQVLRFNVAVDEREKDANGQWVKKTQWVRVQTYQMSLKPYLVKGKQVLVQGEIKFGVWKKNDGTVEPDVTVWEAKLQLVGSAQDAQNAPQSTNDARVAQQPTRQQYAPPQPPQQADSDDLPF